MAEKREKNPRNRCPKCSSTFGYMRLRDKVWQCRSCGHSEKLKDEKEQEA